MIVRSANACIVGAILLLTFSVASAHHGDAGRYDEAITRISGTVVALQLINPHSIIIVDVPDESGQAVRWQVEISNATGLSRLGWTRETLRPGDPVTMAGRAVKSGAPYINLSENSRLARGDTCEELFHSGLGSGREPDYPPLSCEQ